MQKLQLYAWQAEARGNDLHLQANPTVNEIQFRDFQQKKEKLRESTKGSILEKYGGAEHFDTVPKELLTGQTENYVEYSRSGQIIKGQEKAKMRSKYEEDGASFIFRLGLCAFLLLSLLTICLHLRAWRLQFTTTTTQRSGAHGTICRAASGATDAATVR